MRRSLCIFNNRWMFYAGPEAPTDVGAEQAKVRCGRLLAGLLHSP
jgi:hypothetical protein